MLTAVHVKQAKPKEKAYRLVDGGGLYLWVTPAGGKIWRIRYRIEKKEQILTLGKYPFISLVEAREQLAQLKARLVKNIDPKALSLSETEPTFEAVALEWHGKQSQVWSTSHSVSVIQRAQKHLFPFIGSLGISQIRPKQILEITDRLERAGIYEQAHRVRQIADQVFCYAIARELCETNPANAIKGALAPKKTKHFAAILEPEALGIFLRKADAYEGTLIVRQALRLTPHLFVRPGMLRHMEWVELDFKENLWSVPASKMKTDEDIIIPLSMQAKKIIQEIEFYTEGGRYVFPSGNQIHMALPFEAQKPMSENAITKAIELMGYKKGVVTAHGFRATARTLLDEKLEVKVDYIEQQLGHVVRDPLGRAYNRTKHLKARAEMMQRWSDYLDSLK